MPFSNLPYAGQNLTAATLSTWLQEVRPLSAVKTANDPRTSSTYVADSNLFVTIPAIDTYAFEIFLIYDGPTGGSNGRLKTRINFPTGTLTVGHIGGRNDTAVTSGNMTDMDIGAMIATSTSPTSDILLPTVNLGQYLTTWIVGTFVATGPLTSSSTFWIDTAQIVTNSTTTIYKGSLMTLQRQGL